MTITRPPDWTKDAACAGLATRNRDPWSPADHLTPNEQDLEFHHARRICFTCPVNMQCLTHELQMLPQFEPMSMRGGLTPNEITTLARDLGMKWRREAQHGTRSKYVAGCRCPDCRDAHRTYEHHRRLWAHHPTATQTWLTRPVGNGRFRAYPGQLLLFTAGTPPHHITSEGTAA